MGGPDFVIAIIAIIGGVGLAGYIFSNIFKLLRTWLGGNKSAYDDETFERLANAFIRHKKETEKRLQNLEAIVADEDIDSASAQKLEEPRKSIEIEDTSDKKSSTNNSGDLRNMLRE